jgi:hypothetical protein
MAEKRTLSRLTAAGSPAHPATMRAAIAMEYMPWAITPGSPTALATSSLQWIGLKSPEAPA